MLFFNKVSMKWKFTKNVNKTFIILSKCMFDYCEQLMMYVFINK